MPRLDAMPRVRLRVWFEAVCSGGGGSKEEEADSGSAETVPESLTAKRLD